MKLVYFQDPKRNFGDDLNPWLWDRLLPGVVDGDESQGLLLGMGTILEPWFVQDLDPAARKYVLGSGGGMSVPPITLDESWKVHAVRGPLTAAYLGLDPALAATDPAMCIARHWKRPEKPRGAVGFMPHMGSLRRWDWEKICRDAGLEYVDPHGEPLAVLEQIANLKTILTEAMHGAIVADALRVPWLPLQINPINYVGKWHDWAASLKIPIHFKPLPDLYDPLREQAMGDLWAKGARMAVYELRRRSSKREVLKATETLHNYAEHYQPYLSADADLDRAISHYEGILDRFKADLAKG